MEYKEILNKLGFAIYSSGLSQREVSGRIGKSEQYICNVLAGRINLSVKVLLDILLILNIKAKDFFDL